MRFIKHVFVVFFLVFCQLSHSQSVFTFESEFKYLKGSEAGDLSSNWVDKTFDDNSWSVGNAPFWYGDGSGGVQLNDMFDNYSSLYLRKSFKITDVENVESVVLGFDFDDGFICYLNGSMILNVNGSATGELATGQHESGIPEYFSLNPNDIPLNEGENIFAIKAVNITLSGSSDFHIDASFEVEKKPDASLFVPDSVEINFSHPSGYYNQSFNLTMTSPVDSYTISYTLDGSNPVSSSSKVTGGTSVTVNINPTSTSYNRAQTPAVVLRATLEKTGLFSGVIRSRTYIFTDKVKTQSAPGGDWPDENYDETVDQVIDYEMDPDVINDYRYFEEIENALRQIPAISIITDNANLFDTLTGIYTNAEGHGSEWERECSVNLIREDTIGFEVNAGLRIRGGWSRHNGFPKHSFRLFFRSEYGYSKLNYPLFELEGADKFDKLDLRTAQNYSWANSGWSGRKNSFLRDVFSRDLQREMNQPYTRSRYYHLYLNGMYWGLYQTQERSEARYAQTYFGGDVIDYDVVKVSTDNYSYTVETTDGNLNDWQHLYNLCEGAGFSSNANYFALEGKDENGVVNGSGYLVDIDNLIDYMMVIFYTGNFDAPTSSFGSNNGANNFYAINNRNNTSKGYVFFAHDSEHSLIDDAGIWPGNGINEDRVNLGNLPDSVGMKMTMSGFHVFHPQWIHHKLSDNTEYRLRFADKVQEYFFNDGVLTTQKCTDLLNSRVEQIDDAIIAESARWGDIKANPARTKDDDWLPEVNRIRNYFTSRGDIVINQLKEAGLYNSVYPPAVYLNNSKVTAQRIELSGDKTISLVASNASDKLFFTTNGEDPRQIGGNISFNAVEYRSPFKAEKAFVLKVRAYRSGTWGALLQVYFVNEGFSYEDLRITEIMYRPFDEYVSETDTVFGKQYEFIEFKNTSNGIIPLKGLKLNGAINYSFPNDKVLEAGEFFVVASNLAAFSIRNNKDASGEFLGHLSNEGEPVVLLDGKNNIIYNIKYSGYLPWPPICEFKGYSIVPEYTAALGDPSSYKYWRVSYFPGGSPFANDTINYYKEEEVNVEQFSIASISVFPNPTNGQVFINTQMKGEFNYCITDVSGRILKKGYVYSNCIIDINALGLRKGVYYFKFNLPNGVVTKPVIYIP